MTAMPSSIVLMGSRRPNSGRRVRMSFLVTKCADSSDSDGPREIVSRQLLREVNVPQVRVFHGMVNTLHDWQEVGLSVRDFSLENWGRSWRLSGCRWRS